jgi:hypothetical protein
MATKTNYHKENPKDHKIKLHNSKYTKRARNWARKPREKEIKQTATVNKHHRRQNNKKEATSENNVHKVRRAKIYLGLRGCGLSWGAGSETLRARGSLRLDLSLADCGGLWGASVRMATSEVIAQLRTDIGARLFGDSIAQESNSTKLWCEAFKRHARGESAPR